MDTLTRRTLRADALFDTAFGILLLLAPFVGGLYDLLGLPNPQPAIYTQFAGGLLLVCAWLLWRAPSSPLLAFPVALSVGLVNLAGALLIALWLISGALGADNLGVILLVIAACILVFFGVVELRYVRAWADR